MRDTARIARKNVRITFQKSEAVVDKYQNHINTWRDYFLCFAYANTYSAQENGDEVTYENRSITFETRYCPELTAVTSTNYRILFNGETYNIVSIDMMNYQNQSIKFTCRREIRQDRQAVESRQEPL